MSVKKIRKLDHKRKLSLEQLEKFQNMQTIEYIQLLISELKHDKKVRQKAIRLARKRKPTDYIQ